MYLNFYNLKQEPFQITPDPNFLFPSPGHREALASILYGVEQRKGFVLVVGEVGVGKTTVIRSYLEKVDKGRIRTIYLFNANISYRDLLATICREMGCDAGPDETSALLERLHLQLIEEYRQHRNVVLIIDEAQNMPVETLENLRMLSNLETNTDKLIQIVFSAQPEFEQLLARTELRQLRQRIAVRVKIRPLSGEESLSYINHRLARVSLGESAIFSRHALRLIIDKAKGIPRVINVLCDNCLVTSFGRQEKVVSARVAREIMDDLNLGPRELTGWRQAVMVTACCLFMLGIIYLGVTWLLPGLRERSSRAAAPPPATTSQPADTVPTREAAAETTSGTEPSPPRDTASVEEVGRRVVRQGDTLARLVARQYGYSDRSLVTMVKRHNPAIVNENIILPGDVIVFPKHRTAGNRTTP
jgi:general secretion pathway protein A